MSLPHTQDQHQKKEPSSPALELLLQGQEQVREKQYEAAIESLKKALCHNIDLQMAQFLLGCAYHKSGNIMAAIDHYQTAAVLEPKHRETWLNLARARLQVNRPREALSAARQARRSTEDWKNNLEVLNLLVQCLSPLPDPDVNPHLVEEVTACFMHPDIHVQNIVHTGQKMFLQQAVVKALLERCKQGKIDNFETLLSDPALNWVVFNHTLFTTILSTVLLWHRDTEKLLTALRAGILELACADDLSQVLWADSLKFLCALAQQCFINEYIYDLSSYEKVHLEELKAKIQAALPAPNPHDIAILAAYEPLYTQAFARELAGIKFEEPLQSIIRKQILEPQEEEALKADIPHLTSIDDKISKLVKEQYETFPYPRWINTAVSQSFSFRDIIKSHYPRLPSDHLPARDLKPQMLIAGCGTGKQSIENALWVKDADVLAIDISASSIAYAVRKTREKQIHNIHYGLADILKLRELKREFDVIHCGGVLHHMHDPMKGWQVLYDILKPGGFMCIALYSEIARRSVVDARRYIEQNDIPDTLEGIRILRAHVKKLPESHPMKKTMEWQDFYSASQCRDLLFHVQEHRYTALDLRKSIKSLGLEFLGFQNVPPDMMMAYKNTYLEDPHGLNLKNWHEFELRYPQTFAAMYQFWLYKAD